VVSTWKQRLEESEKERKSLQAHPQEIDIYGDGFSLSNQESVTVKEEEAPMMKRPLVNMNKSATTLKIDSNVVVEEPPRAFTWSVPENNNKNSSPPRKTLVNINKTNKGVGGNTEVINAINKPEPASLPTLGNSHTLPSKPGHSLVNINKIRAMPQEEISNEKTVILTVETNNSVNVRGKTLAADTVDNGMSMQERKKFFQGVKPVESNGKEAPIPAVNLKSNIATIQRVFQQRQQQMPMQRTGSARESTASSTMTSPASSGATTPVTVKTFSSERSGSNLASPAISSTEMVQKLLGKSNSFNMESFRRTPSPASSTTSTSTMSSASPCSERHTPSPTISDGPNNTIRISTGSSPAKPTATSTIKNVGNKSIIIVSSAQDSPAPNTNNANNNNFNVSAGGAVSNSIFKQQMKVNGAPPPQINITTNNRRQISSSANQSVADGKQTQLNNSIKFNINGSTPKAPPPVIDINMSTPVSRPILVEQNSKKVQPSAFQEKTVSQKSNDTKPNQSTTKITVDSSPRSNGTSNGSPVPPPPPPMAPIDSKPVGVGVSLAAAGRSKSVSSLTNGKSNSNSSPPTSPSGNSDPRSEIFNVIKNSGGNFGLRKTGSTMLLK
jgi:hypothetical protein